MPLRKRSLLGASILLATPLVTASASAADIVDGKLVFDKNALATYSFEAPDDIAQVGGVTLAWQTVQGYPEVRNTAFSDADASMLVADSLEGSKGLRVAKGTQVGVAILDTAVFEPNAPNRISVTMWGKAYGAEPALQVVYTNLEGTVGPSTILVNAVRTGRETNDGWVEYSTGPIDGSLLGGKIPLQSIVLTARYATTEGMNSLVDYDASPAYASYNPFDAPLGYAIIDAVEIKKESGSATAANACSAATIDTDCGANQECMYGHCIDGALSWGPVPLAEEARTAIVDRWSFIATSLQGDRASIARAPAIAAGLASLPKETSPRKYFRALNAATLALRDSHTELGWAPSSYHAFYPNSDTYSGAIDVCFGLVDDDVGGSGTHYGVFTTANSSFAKGDLVTAIDGMDPDAWIKLVAHNMFYVPSDSAADPSHNAMHLGELIGRYANKVSLTRCTADACTPLPDVAVSDKLYSAVLSREWPGGYSSICGLRFHPSVSNPPTDDDEGTAVAETVDGITSVQFNGFVPPAPYTKWEQTMSDVFVGDAKVLVDARVGYGGHYDVGEWLFHLLRGDDQPYGMYPAARGTVADPDPDWLLGPAWDNCSADIMPTDLLCAWHGGNVTFTKGTAAGGATKIAWVNGNDVSMNDTVPRLLQGRANFRIFGPHASHGALGAVSRAPAILSTWGNGAIQVLDTRFGTDAADARANAWESGHGVVPDEIVVQKVSDVLNDEDTTLVAAKAWLAQ